MEASCFCTSKSFTTKGDLLPSLIRPREFAPSALRRKRLGRFHGVGGRFQSPVTCCSIRPSTPDGDGDGDGAEPIIQSDWRSFRARLVAVEKATSVTASFSLGAHTPIPRVPTSLGDMWAHLIHEPEKGCLLIASENLDGVHIFERTVILLVTNGTFGPTGVILNRPSLMSIKETRSTAMDAAGVFSDRPLFFGGPLEEGLFLVRSPSGGGGAGASEDAVGKSGVFDEVMQGLYYGTKESVGCAAEMVKRSVVGAGDFQFFDGCCGWEREQLREEIRAGYWSVAACSPGVIETAGAGMWEQVVGLVGGKKVW